MVLPGPETEGDVVCGRQLSFCESAVCASMQERFRPRACLYSRGVPEEFGVCVRFIFSSALAKCFHPEFRFGLGQIEEHKVMHTYR